MTDEEIHNIYLHMSGKAEGLVEATGNADFPVLFARAILEYGGLTKDMQNMASKSTYKEQLETKDAPVAWMSEDEHTVYTSKQVDGCFQHDHIPLYTTPQTKEWVGLTKEDADNIECWFREEIENDRFSVENLIAHIEAKLKERNT